MRRYPVRYGLLFLLLGLLVACGAPVAAPRPLPPTVAPLAPPSEEGQTVVLTPVTSTDTLCPEVPRPALVMNAMGTEGDSLTITSLDGTARCPVDLGTPLRSTVSAAAGSLFYVGDTGEPATVQSVWQLGADGTPRPLEFTGISVAEGAGGFYSFAVSPDGQKIAWAYSVADMGAQSTTFRNSLWVANLDGSEQVTLLDAEMMSEYYAMPVRFSADGQELVYGLAPMGLGGMWNAFTGRYQALYTIPTAGGETTLLFDCTSQELFLCLNDVTDDVSAVGYTNSSTQEIVLVARDGSVIRTLTAPGADYLGYPTFGPTGELAFVSAIVAEDPDMGPPLPMPGSITLLAPPYTGEPTLLLSAPGVGTLWEWIDADHLAFFRLEEATSGIGIVSRTGETSLTTTEFPVAVLND